MNTARDVPSLSGLMALLYVVAAAGEVPSATCAEGWTQAPAGLFAGCRRTLDAKFGGYSDLVYHGEHLWAVAERTGGEESWSLVQLSLEGTVIDHFSIETVSSDGPGGQPQAESLAWFDGRFVVGTETDNGSPPDRFYRLETSTCSADSVCMTTVASPPAIDWNTLAPEQNGGNHGTEGLCRGAGYWVAAGERRIRSADPEHEFAPVAVAWDGDTSWRAYRVRLHTPAGRISALACDGFDENGELKVWAIERKEQARTLLQFTLPVTGRDVPVEMASTVHHVDGIDHECANWEGLAIAADEFILISDSCPDRGCRDPHLLWRVPRKFVIERPWRNPGSCGS